MNSKNKICDVLKRKRNVISLKIKLDQIGKSSSMSYSIYVTFSGTFYDINRGNTVNRMPIAFSLKAKCTRITFYMCLRLYYILLLRLFCPI